VGVLPAAPINHCQVVSKLSGEPDNFDYPEQAFIQSGSAFAAPLVALRGETLRIISELSGLVSDGL